MTTPWTNVNIITNVAEPDPTGVYSLGSPDFQWKDFYSFNTSSNNSFVTVNLTVGNSIFVNNNLEIANNLIASRDLTVTGNSSIGRNLSVNNNLTVSGNVTISNNLSVTGGMNVSSTSVSGNINVQATGDIVFAPGAGIFANGSIGTAGQLLASNGSSVYWTIVMANTGLVSNATGIHVLANNGIIANSTGVFVRANTGLVSNATGIFALANTGLVSNATGIHVLANSGIVSNSTGVFVNATGIAVGTVPTARLGSGTADSTTFLRGDQTWVTVGGGTGTVTAITAGSGLAATATNPITTTGTVSVLSNNGIVSNSTGTFVRANNGIVANTTGVFVNANNGIVANTTGVFVNANNGIVANATGVFVRANNGIVANTTGVFVLANNGIVANTTGVFVLANSGIVANTTGVFVNANNGIVANTTGVFVRANNGIVANATGVFVTPSNGSIVVSSTGVSVNAAYIATIAANSATGSLTNTFTVGTSAYFVANGNLGIGVTTPATRIEVRAGSVTATTINATSGAIIRRSALGDDGQIELYRLLDAAGGPYIDFSTTSLATDADFRIQYRTPTADGLIFYNGPGSTALAFLRRSDGNFGLGTLTPASRLDVRGNVAINDNTLFLGSSQTSTPYIKTSGTGSTQIGLHFGPTVSYSFALQDDRNVVVYDGSTAVWSAGSGVSDINHKKEVSPTATSGIDKINALQVVDFKWKDESPLYDGDKPHIGFIAQDVESVHSDAIKNINGSYLIHKEELVPLLVKAIQEQQQQIEELKGRITALEANP